MVIYQQSSEHVAPCTRTSPVATPECLDLGPYSPQRVTALLSPALCDQGADSVGARGLPLERQLIEPKSKARSSR